MSEANASEQSFVSHLIELRSRVMYAVGGVLLIFLLLFPFANDLYTYVAGPLMAALPQGTSMIATQVASPFLTPFKLSLFAALFIAMPLVLYQFWAFVAPGLYQHEKRLAVPLLVSSILLFYCGMAFAYYVVFPLIFGFLTGVAPDGVAVMTDISSYLSFVLALFFAFGIAFEVPIATILLVMTGVTTAKGLAQQRPYVIVGAFVVGMLLTPPDVISQTLLALPMWLLFETGILLSRYFVSNKQDESDDASADEPEPEDKAAATASASDPTPADTNGAVESVESIEEAEFKPLTEAEMDAELDRMDDEDEDDDSDEYDSDEAPGEELDLAEGDPVENKILLANIKRGNMDFKGARKLLYEVLAEGNEEQIRTAKNILDQLDDLD